MSSLILNRNPNVTGAIKKLPASKSISNRVLILDALSGNQSKITNLANARDTKIMEGLLGSSENVLDVMDAGTTMRFLTAYFAVSGQNKTLTGTARMKERPIGLLVNALKAIGVNIKYLENESFPPLKILGFEGQKASEVSLPGDVSSQYISALMMVAPKLPQGLTINLTGKVGSWPYIEMTAKLMKAFKVECQIKNRLIKVPTGQHQATSIKVEPDWSALGYWFAFVALAKEGNLVLKEVDSQSIQGDRVVVELMKKLGVTVKFENEGAVLSKTGKVVSELEWDFKDCPDLAQTILPVCALKGISGSFSGLESLYIKETDRITALQNELAKVGAKLESTKKGFFQLTPGIVPQKRIKIETYHDHRMAMGFAPWATLMDLEIENPQVVDKSYPDFWEHLSRLRFDILRNA